MLSGISSPCCTWLTFVKLVKPRTLAGLRRRSRACRSDFGDGDFSCGAAEAYVPAGSSWTEPAARVRMLEAKGTTPGHSPELRSSRRTLSWVVSGANPDLERGNPASKRLQTAHYK